MRAIIVINVLSFIISGLHVFFIFRNDRLSKIWRLKSVIKLGLTVFLLDPVEFCSNKMLSCTQGDYYYDATNTLFTV